MKYFPERVDPRVVAARKRRILRAKTHTKVYTDKDLAEFRQVSSKHQMLDESLLKKQKQTWAEKSVRVFKAVHGDQVTSTATLVCDKIVVPLHSHVEGKPFSVYNSSTSAQLSGELIPIADDLGIYFTHGVIHVDKRVVMRPPQNELAIQIGFTDAEQVEPGFGVGFASASGLYDAQTAPGDCGGPVYACADGALIGFHIAGGQHVNRFVPMTAELAKRLAATGPVLNSMLFH